MSEYDYSPVADALEGHLKHRQTLILSHHQFVARAREHREGIASSRRTVAEMYGRPAPELAGASGASATYMDEARRRRVMLASARPGKVLPPETGMSAQQLDRHLKMTGWRG